MEQEHYHEIIEPLKEGFTMGFDLVRGVAHAVYETLLNKVLPPEAVELGERDDGQ